MAFVLSPSGKRGVAVNPAAAVAPNSTSTTAVASAAPTPAATAVASVLRSNGRAAPSRKLFAKLARLATFLPNAIVILN